MIPDFNYSGVLPPFLPDKNPAIRDAMAPYQVELMDFVEKFCTSAIRSKILQGFIKYRLALKRSVSVRDFNGLMEVSSRMLKIQKEEILMT